MNSCAKGWRCVRSLDPVRGDRKQTLVLQYCSCARQHSCSCVVERITSRGRALYPAEQSNRSNQRGIRGTCLLVHQNRRKILQQCQKSQLLVCCGANHEWRLGAVTSRTEQQALQQPERHKSHQNNKSNQRGTCLLVHQNNKSSQRGTRGITVTATREAPEARAFWCMHQNYKSSQRGIRGTCLLVHAPE